MLEKLWIKHFNITRQRKRSLIYANFSAVDHKSGVQTHM